MRILSVSTVVQSASHIVFKRNMLSVTLEEVIIGCNSWGRNKTSWLDNEASHFSSREPMITCRSSGLLHLRANWLLGPASSWQAPVFPALSCPRSTKDNLEVFYLCLGVQFLVCQERREQLSLCYTIHMNPTHHRQGSKCFSVFLSTWLASLFWITEKNLKWWNLTHVVLLYVKVDFVLYSQGYSLN